MAGALKGLGVGRGDRVVVYMPTVPEAVMTMLACARIGAVHSVVFGGFAPKELAARIEDARPTVAVATPGREPGRCSTAPTVAAHSSVARDQTRRA
jgi:propionyl-CoA synthetase